MRIIVNNNNNLEFEKLNSKHNLVLVGKEFERIKTKRATQNILPIIFVRGSQFEDASNPFIYSLTKFHPLSFLTGNKNYGLKGKQLLYPSPNFVDDKRWQLKPDLSKTEVLRGMVIHDGKGLLLIDKSILVKFDGLIGDMIKQIIRAALGGAPVSLNVKIFEPKSTLQRITDYWSFAPKYLNESAKSESAIERMKYAITFAISGFYIPTKQLKPFNPLIGETFQGEFENGAKVYVEHTSHYPTIARFLINDELYRLHGYFDFSTKTESWGSKLNVYQKGPITIDYKKTKDSIIYNMPNIQLLNAKSTEDRSAIWVDSMNFIDVKNNLRAIVKFGGSKTIIHSFEGYIYENIYDKNYRFNYEKEVSFGNDHKIDYSGKKFKNKILSTIKGSWLKDISFDDKKLWNMDIDVPNWIRPNTAVLPSDGRFREDIIWLYRAFFSKNETEKQLYESYSQGWKVTIEQIQRAEREIRKKNRPKK